MAKAKSATRVAKTKKTTKKGAEDHEDARERHTAETVMQTVLTEAKVEAEKVRLDQWVPIECPHCGEGTELHVFAEMDCQSIDRGGAGGGRPGGARGGGGGGDGRGGGEAAE